MSRFLVFGTLSQAWSGFGLVAECTTREAAEAAARLLGSGVIATEYEASPPGLKLSDIIAAMQSGARQ